MNLSNTTNNIGIRLLLFATLLASILVSACKSGGGSSDTLKGPATLVQDFGIAYIRSAVPEDDEADLRRLFNFRPGADLIFRDLASPSATETNVTFPLTGGLGHARDPEVSYDGSRIIFSLRLPEDEDASDDEQPTWNIWEYTISSGALRRLISSDILAAAGQDLDPYYLPDGRIVFTSTRQRQTKSIQLDEGKPQFAALEEDRREAAAVLHVMDENGDNIQQISFNQSHDINPYVADNGKIVFSRWDNISNISRYSLYQMNPDGTDLQLLYGVNSHNTGSNGDSIQFMQAREMNDGRYMALGRPFQDTDEGGAMIGIDTQNYIENSQTNANNLGVLFGPAQTGLFIDDILTDGSPSPAGRFQSVFPLRDGSNRALVSWSQCRLTDDTNIVPCTEDFLADLSFPDEADPLYSLFIYDIDQQVQTPIFQPTEGIMYTDAVAAQPRTLPTVIANKIAGIDLNQGWSDEQVGVLNIRSVYDHDGGLYNYAGAPASITEIADPQQTLANERPARFVRIVKGVYLPGDEVKDFENSAFGRSTRNLMREIIGYAPIEPDGSVRVKVPANVPLAISVLDSSATRRSRRHNNWLQVRPGEEVHCIGCHSTGTGISHGRSDAFQPLYDGAPFDGYQFPNTLSSVFANFGETMAEARTRLDPNALNPTIDVLYTDEWTDPVASGRAADAPLTLRYADLTTLSPATGSCQSSWNNLCRTVINYESHIHPLWGKDRGANTCTACHTNVDAMSVPMVPEAQLDLSDGASGQQPDHFKSYRELLFNDDAQEVNLGTLQDILVQATDGIGNPLFEIDEDGELILDGAGMPIPVLVTINVPASLSTAGASGSPRFMSIFEPGGTHFGRLDPAELRLIIEWADIGAQYYNNPFDAP